MRKRSSWDSGSGYVPVNSSGFWVAITRNALLEDEVLAVVVEDGDARHVGGEEIGRELDAAERAGDGLGGGAGEGGLADAGNVLEEHVAAGEEAGEFRRSVAIRSRSWRWMGIGKVCRICTAPTVRSEL
jgi:hypothetical protein